MRELIDTTQIIIKIIWFWQKEENSVYMRIWGACDIKDLNIKRMFRRKFSCPADGKELLKQDLKSTNHNV